MCLDALDLSDYTRRRLKKRRREVAFGINNQEKSLKGYNEVKSEFLEI